jgi:hypothetical protein
MGLFEQYPWLLIPLIVGTVEAWNGLKRLLRRKTNNNLELQRGETPKK